MTRLSSDSGDASSVLWQLVDDCKKYLDKQFKPDRYNGDIEKSRGGVRGVIPEKRIY